MPKPPSTPNETLELIAKVLLLFLASVVALVVMTHLLRDYWPWVLGVLAICGAVTAVMLRVQDSKSRRRDDGW